MSLEGALATLESQLDNEDDPEERRAIMDELREIERELNERDRWEREGDERGWR